MSKYLLIVESPTKSKTISKYLGKDYIIKATYGHIRDLPAYRLGVNIKDNFSPYYTILKEKTKVLKELNTAAKKSAQVYIATDPDREGEAIAWHIAQSLEVDPKKIKRIVFNEITKKAVTDSIKNCRDIDMQLVDAQQARRVLDRLIGYKLSPILSKKIQRGLSAGRVQSVAVKIICDREKEITDFNPKEFWHIDANLLTNDKKELKARLFAYQKETNKIEVKNKKEADHILKNLSSKKYTAFKIDKTRNSRQPAPPFITSSLQQEASKKFNWTTKKTMFIAQQLYEGVEIQGEATGLITYMRTDSFRISEEAYTAALPIIKQLFGPDYIPAKKNTFKQKSKVQDAHESIRPTYIDKTPKSLEKLLQPDLFKLYNLIWKRFIASQMKPAIIENKQIVLSVDSATKEKYFFKAHGHSIIFSGFLKLYSEAIEDQNKDQPTSALPEIQQNQELTLQELNSEQKFTQPPSRYTEAALVKELEEKGIGRPSTYAPILSTIQDRHYVVREKKTLFPSELGIIVNEKLHKFFDKIININFTASLEVLLDEIIEGKHDWHKVVQEFYDPFSERLEIANKQMEKINQDKPTDEICEKCSSPMVIKSGRYGEFLACSNFPACKNTKNLKANLDVKCPECSQPLAEKRSKKGKVFYGCSGYPECKYAVWDKPIPETCEKCKNPFMLVKINKYKKEIKYCPNCKKDENKKNS
ncbi:type I DNA topoisomerase [Candidatus Margulisiibacteriota bacterium]